MREASERSPQVDRMKFIKERKIERMTTEGHYKGSEESHNKIKKKESQEECNKDLLELARDIWCFEKRIQAVAEET